MQNIVGWSNIRKAHLFSEFKNVCHSENKLCYFVHSNREFTKRMDGNLPFYYWTLNERYSDEDLPSFDDCPAFDEDQDLRTHPLRLHRLRLNQRENSSIFVAGRAHLPSRHKKSIRQSFHKPESILPDPL